MTLAEEYAERLRNRFDASVIDGLAAGLLEAQESKIARFRQAVSAAPRESLAVFVDHWGIDAYAPPLEVMDAVRMLVATALSDAEPSKGV